jgi:phosphoglycerate dehydrogenase-like enzyme
MKAELSMNPTRNLVIQGATSVHDVPGLEHLTDRVDIRCAATEDELRAALEGAEILLGWDFRADELRSEWDHAATLRWIHWGGAGVDAVLFPELVESEVVLTNSRGIFDRAMAEYVLGIILCFAKGLPETIRSQAQRTWNYRLTEVIEGKNVIIVGVGSVGRAIARLLSGAGMKVSGIGRSARADDSVFGAIHGSEDLTEVVPEADYVVNVLPLTDHTRGLFSSAVFKAMRPTARLINVGRGATVDDGALVAALQNGEIAGAALDVFDTEPLPSDSPLWSIPQVIVSPHISGDYVGFPNDVARIFLENFERYCAGEPLLNVVDKRAGYVRG